MNATCLAIAAIVSCPEYLVCQNPARVMTIPYLIGFRCLDQILRLVVGIP
jgi:hypothetical protein